MKSWMTVAAGLVCSAPGMAQQCPLQPVNTIDVRAWVSDAAIANDPATGVPTLFIAGNFAQVGALQNERLLRRTPGGWAQVPGFPDGLNTRSLAGGVDANGPALFVAGWQNTTEVVWRYSAGGWVQLADPPTFTGPVACSWVNSAVVFDPDGAGPIAPSLHVLIAYDIPPTVDGGVFRWDGAAWVPMGGTVLGKLAVYDPDGAGPRPPELYAAGMLGMWMLSAVPSGFLMRLEGSSWRSVGRLDYPSAIHTWERTGAPPLLVVGGTFTEVVAGSTVLPLQRIAAWNGDQWVALGEGFPGTYTEVQSLTTLDPDGAGPHPALLLAGGTFRRSDGAPANGLGAWDGSQWMDFGGGVQSPSGSVRACVPVIQSFVEYPGQRPSLMANVTGLVAERPAAPLVTWHAAPGGAGGHWENLFDGPGGIVHALAVHDEGVAGGAGQRLFAAGRFTYSGDLLVNGIARWDGSAWSALGSGLEPVPANLMPVARTMAVFNDGSGNALYVGGTFRSAGGLPVFNIARWRGQQWRHVGAGLDGGGGWVLALEVHDPDGPGPQPARLHAGGNFALSGGAPVRKLAVWNGTTWNEVAGGLSGPGAVRALLSWDDGTGPALYIAGDPLSAGGLATNLAFKLTASGWQALPDIVQPQYSYSRINALTLHDAGEGLRLYAGGFHRFGQLARLDPADWVLISLSTPTATGPREVFALRSITDCHGRALYADRVRIDAAGLQQLSPKPNGGVRAISPPLRDAYGSWHFLGGDFVRLDSIAAASIARITRYDCYANCDRNATQPLLNVEDFTCFINAFVQGAALPHHLQLDHYANCDQSTTPPALNIHDFNCFINAYALGCP
jgi:hypothetical protein